MARSHAWLGIVLAAFALNQDVSAQTLGLSLGAPSKSTLPAVRLSVTPPNRSQTRLPSPPPAAVSVENAVPSMSVKTSGPETLVVNRPATYSVILNNHSDFEAKQAQVRISLPSWVELQESQASSGSVRSESEQDANRPVVWQIPSVRARGQVTLSITVLPRSGQPFDLNVDLTVRPSQVRREITIQEPQLVAELRGSTEIIYGESAAWQMIVSNPGTGEAQDVLLEVRSGFDALTSTKLGSLAPAEKRVVNLELTPRQIGTASLDVSLTGHPRLATQTSRAYTVRRPELSVEVSGPPFEYAGTQAAYNVLVRNSGDAPAKNVTAQLSLPREAAYLRGIRDAEVVNNGIRWVIPHIAPGAQKVYQAVYELRKSGDHEVVALLHTRDQEKPTAVVVTEVLAIADLKLEVVDPKGPRAVGSDQEYEIRVTNQGTDIARQITIIAICSPEVEPVSVTGQAATQSGQIFFRPVEELLPGQTEVRKVTARALQAGNFGFRVVVKCYEPEARLASEETTRFFVR